MKRRIKNISQSAENEKKKKKKIGTRSELK